MKDDPTSPHTHWRQVLQLGWPVSLQAVAAASFALVDVAMVQTLGAEAVGAVGLAGRALFVLTMLLATGVGMFMSALNVKYRDIRYALPFCIQIWMFASPIIYPVTLVPKQWRWLLHLNPMAGIIDGYRAAIFGKPFDWQGLTIASGITIAVLVYAAFHFRRMEKTFADVV